MAGNVCGRACGAGTEANYFNEQLDKEKLLGLAHERHKRQLAIIGLCVYPTTCDPKAFNQVVLPATYQTDDGQTQNGSPYIYGLPSTANHCEGLPGTCGAPGPDAGVNYRWPVDDEGTTRYARVSSISTPDQFLTLPFSDTGVKRGAIWRYGNGSWHHAGDYGKGGPTFEVKAAAPGRVIFIGYEWFAGNTIVMSHDVDGRQDAYRTIYMHMRNGAAADCAAAWNVSVPRCPRRVSRATRSTSQTRDAPRTRRNANRTPRTGATTRRRSIRPCL